MNETIRSIFDRRSNRGFTEEPLTAEEIELLQQCALASPTAMNAQSWHFTFVTDRSLIGQVEDAVVEIVCGTGDKSAIDRLAGRKNKVFYDAPLAVFISSDNNNGWSEVDAGIAVQNLALAAHSMGLGSVIIGMCKCAFAGERGEQLAKALHFPEGYRFTIAAAIGHPSVTKEAHDIKPDKVEVI